MNTNLTIAAAPGKPGMSPDRKAAVWIGVLYIIGTAGMVLSVVVTNAILSGPDYLAQVAAQPRCLAGSKPTIAVVPTPGSKVRLRCRS
jgi:hypothetical protein